MRKFSEEEIKSMSRLEVQAIVCEGLAEVATMLSNQADDKVSTDHFAHQAQEFSSFGKLFHNAANPRKARPPAPTKPPRGEKK